jgi:hypothetical protein
MAEMDLDAVRREFATLTGLFEDAAFLASAGQGIKNVGDGCRQLKRIARTMHRIHKRLSVLERHLQ